MAGAFARVDAPGPIGPERAQEAHPTLRVFELYRQGALSEGAQTVIQTTGGGLLAIREPGKIIVGDAPIAVRPSGIAPVAFGCPLCDADRYKLYLKGGLWGCPKCLGLDRASRHRHRSVRGYWRALQIRRKIAPGSALFDPLPVMRINAPKFWRLAIELRRIEASLAGLVADNASVLEKRHERRRKARQPGQTRRAGRR